MQFQRLVSIFSPLPLHFWAIILGIPIEGDKHNIATFVDDDDDDH